MRKGLKRIALDEVKVTPADIRNILQAFGGTDSPQITDSNLGDDEVEVLAQTVSNIPALSTLNITGNKVGDRGLEALAKAMPQLPQLQCIYLDPGSGNANFTENGLWALVSAKQSLKIYGMPAKESLELAQHLAAFKRDLAATG